MATTEVDHMTFEQFTEGMADFLQGLAMREYARMGENFALGAIYKTTPTVDLQRRIDTCSRAVAILKGRNTIFQWSWMIEHQVRVVVNAELKEPAPPSTQDGPR